MAILKIDNVGIGVKDLSLVADFFENKVGFKVDRRLHTSPPSADIHISENQYLFMFQTDSTFVPGERRADVSSNPPGLDHISFTTDDIDRTYSELKARGVTFEGEPQSWEVWGIRMVGFRDPEGNWYYLVQSLKK
jgi:catechol 2,3-dioxygenase-like lactoylglutathione lyase family enzyme